MNSHDESRLSGSKRGRSSDDDTDSDEELFAPRKTPEEVLGELNQIKEKIQECADLTPHNCSEKIRKLHVLLNNANKLVQEEGRDMTWGDKRELDKKYSCVDKLGQNLLIAAVAIANSGLSDPRNEDHEQIEGPQLSEEEAKKKDLLYKKLKPKDLYISKDESEKKETDYHALLRYIRCMLHHMGMRCGGDYVWKRKSTAEGHPTLAWEQHKSIEECVYELTREHLVRHIWVVTAKEKNPVPQVVNYLSKANDPDFPFVAKNRHLFSFENGVYFADKNEFLTYPIEDKTFFNSDQPAACNHFDGVEFPVDLMTAVDNREIPWTDIKYSDNDALRQMLDFQEIPEDAQEWIYFSIGRMLYPIGQHDDLQYFLFLKGVAGCGKSTIIKLIQHIYPKEKVGVVSNNIEKKFGLSSFHDKWILVAPEIKHDWEISVTEFQSMASGESISVAVKNKNTIQTDWAAQLIMAGNENIGFVDIADSVGRRLLTCDFNKRPTEENPHLLTDMKQHIGHYILKFNCAYMDMINKGCNSSLWRRVPQYFQDTRNANKRAMNPVLDFLESKRLTFDSNSSMKFQDFCDACKQYSREVRNENLKFNVFEPHKILSLLNDKNVTPTYDRDRHNRIIKSKISMLHGCDFASDDPCTNVPEGGRATGRGAPESDEDSSEGDPIIR